MFDDAWNEPDGRVGRLECELQPNSTVETHYHPATSQWFEVVSGTLHVRVNGRTSILNAGERATTRLGEMHAQWNEGPMPVRAMEGYEPPLDIEPYFTVLPHALASKNILKMAVFASDFDSVCRLASGPKRLTVLTIARLGRLLGYARWYAALLSD